MIIAITLLENHFAMAFKKGLKMFIMAILVLGIYFKGII
jgi:hypothetical protein